jgi:ABC-2 type transport system permease protein/oleandomycin transport system permease protein
VTSTYAPTAAIGAQRRIPLFRGFRDMVAVAGRNLTVYRRVPQLVIFSTIQPVVFVLLFRYVYGGVFAKSINVPYVDYLMPGIFVQTVVFGSIGTAVGLASDTGSGLIERFRSLPMARSSVLTGRTLADLIRSIFIALLMVAVGFAVGFRLHHGVMRLVLAMLLVLLFAYALSWIFATVGLVTGSPETAQAASFPVLAPLVFASSAFIPVNTMPHWLRVFAEHQPVSVTASAARALLLGGPTASYVTQSVLWCVGITVVFAPLAALRYRAG